MTALNNSHSQSPLVQIQGEFMIVNGKEIPYAKQMVRNNNFYLTDLGIDLPLEEGVKKFD
jgi:hypothetical protein